MLRVEYSDVFVQHFKERANRRIKRLYRDRLTLFLKDSRNKSLRNHPFWHDRIGYRSFSLTDESGTDDFRVIFQKMREGYLFVDFGTHDQVYRRRKQRVT